MTTTHKIERKIHISEIEKLYEKLNNPNDQPKLGNFTEFQTQIWSDIKGENKTLDFVFISKNKKSEKGIILLTFETNNEGFLTSVSDITNSKEWIKDKFIELITYYSNCGLSLQMWKDLHRWLGLGDYIFDFEMGH
jgi:hypothetical protein